MHSILLLVSVYNMFFQDNYIIGAKIAYFAILGLLLFPTLLLFFPLQTKRLKITIILGLTVYVAGIIGFLVPEILKNYWGILVCGATVFFVLSLYQLLTRARKGENWEKILLCITTIVAIVPVLFALGTPLLFNLSGLALGVISLWSIYRLVYIPYFR